MKKGRQHQREPVLNICERICAVFLGVFEMIQFAREGELPLSIFSKIFTVLLGRLLFIAAGIFNICREERQIYANSVRRLEEDAEQDEELQQKYGYKMALYKKMFKENCIDKSIRKYRMSLPILIVMIFIMGISNVHNAHAYFSGIKDVICGTTAENEKKESEDMPVDKTLEENEPEVKEETVAEKDRMDTAEQVAEERDMKWRFVLDRSDAIYLTDSGRENQVFFYTNESLENSVPAMMEQWKNGNKKGVEYKEIEDDEGNTFDTYTALEDKFKEDVADAAQYIDMEEWIKYAPHSAEYDKCISGREELNQVEMGGEKGSYKVWWLLANDYLYFAQEYEMQTENVEAVSYYYINSTYCCMEALQYAVTKEEYDLAFSFLTMRYQDICRYECIMPLEEKERAEQIHLLLVSDIE